MVDRRVEAVSEADGDFCVMRRNGRRDAMRRRGSLWRVYRSFSVAPLYVLCDDGSDLDKLSE